MAVKKLSEIQQRMLADEKRLVDNSNPEITHAFRQGYIAATQYAAEQIENELRKRNKHTN